MTLKILGLRMPTSLVPSESRLSGMDWPRFIVGVGTSDRVVVKRRAGSSFARRT